MGGACNVKTTSGSDLVFLDRYYFSSLTVTRLNNTMSSLWKLICIFCINVYSMDFNKGQRYICNYMNYIGMVLDIKVVNSC